MKIKPGMLISANLDLTVYASNSIQKLYRNEILLVLAVRQSFLLFIVEVLNNGSVYPMMFSDENDCTRSIRLISDA